MSLFFYLTRRMEKNPRVSTSLSFYATIHLKCGRLPIKADTSRSDIIYVPTHPIFRKVSHGVLEASKLIFRFI